MIHYGPAKDIEEYLQESGRAGQDISVQSYALLLNYKGSTCGAFISACIRHYVKDSSNCKRKLMLSELQDVADANSLHTCCSVCAEKFRCLHSCDFDKCSCGQQCLPFEETVSEAEFHITNICNKGENDYSAF